MFLFDWFYSVLAILGLWQKEAMEAKILLFGLDTPRKTTLLQMLNNEHQPTQYPTSEQLGFRKIKFKAFDLGGHQIARRAWRDYYVQVDAVAYFLDATDRLRFKESSDEIAALLGDDSWVNVPILILINRDKPYPSLLKLAHYVLGTDWASYYNIGRHENNSPFDMFFCSMVQKGGYGELIKFLSQYIR